MKVTYLPYHDYRAGQVVMCRDLEIGEDAKDQGNTFRMESDGLYFNGRFHTTMKDILDYRRDGTWCNREVTII